MRNAIAMDKYLTWPLFREQSEDLQVRLNLELAWNLALTSSKIELNRGDHWNYLE